MMKEIAKDYIDYCHTQGISLTMEDAAWYAYCFYHQNTDGLCLLHSDCAGACHEGEAMCGATDADVVSAVWV